MTTRLARRNTFFLRLLHYCYYLGALLVGGERQPRSQDLSSPHPRLVTCLSGKFIFMGGTPIVQNIDAASICHIQNQLSFTPGSQLESSLSILH